MRAAKIPLETMWNDIDLYQAFRDFTSDPVSFNGGEVREWIEELVGASTQVDSEFNYIRDAAQEQPAL